MTTRTISEWFELYSESHLDKTNKLIHFVMVPTIYFTIVGLFWSIPRLDVMQSISPYLNWSVVVLAIAITFYARLSFMIMMFMAAFTLLCMAVSYWIEASGWSVWQVSLAIFVVAWIGQFWGHKIEGKKPSFFEDLQFLMIGPAWVAGFLLRKMNISY